MIVARITGGLGNQMFQYAAGRALAQRHQTQLLLDIRDFETQSLREFALHRLSIQAEVASEHHLRQWPTWSRKPAALLQRIGVSTNRYKQPSFAFDPGWHVLSDNLLIEGYFQSEQYFSDIKSILKKEFLPLCKPTENNHDFESALTSAESVMIHIRRGDYIINSKAFKTHGLCSISYYESAIKQIRTKLMQPQFFIFSDDLDWARKYLSLGNEGNYIEGNTKAPEIDLYLMSRCKHFIIANSSFSWWGAWLGFYEKSICIAPRPWFDKVSFDERDLIPADWQRLGKY